MHELIELTLRVSTRDEAQDVRLAETLARVAVGLSAEDAVDVSTDVYRHPIVCHHEHDELRP